MKKYIALFAATALLGFSLASPAHAMDLATAKQEGLVGEQENGLVGLIDPNAPVSIQLLVKETNQGRLQVYNETASKQHIPVSQVQTIAAQKIYSLTPGGQFIQRNGRWVKK